MSETLLKLGNLADQFQQVIDVEKEVATGNGVQTIFLVSYGGSLTPGKVYFRYTVGGQIKDAGPDDGNGNLSDGTLTATIQYDLGTASLTFTTPPDANTSIYMYNGYSPSQVDNAKKAKTSVQNASGSFISFQTDIHDKSVHMMRMQGASSSVLTVNMDDNCNLQANVAGCLDTGPFLDEFVGSTIDELLSKVNDLVNLLDNTLSQALSGAKDAIEQGLTSMTNAIQSFADQANAVMNNKIIQCVSNLLGLAGQSELKSALDDIQSKLDQGMSTLDIMNDIKSGISNQLQDQINQVTSAYDNIKQSLGCPD